MQVEEHGSVKKIKSFVVDFFGFAEGYIVVYGNDTATFTSSGLDGILIRSESLQISLAPGN